MNIVVCHWCGVHRFVLRHHRRRHGYREKRKVPTKQALCFFFLFLVRHSVRFGSVCMSASNTELKTRNRPAILSDIDIHTHTHTHTHAGMHVTDCGKHGEQNCLQWLLYIEMTRLAPSLFHTHAQTQFIWKLSYAFHKTNFFLFLSLSLSLSLSFSSSLYTDLFVVLSSISYNHDEEEVEDETKLTFRSSSFV